MPNIFIKAFFCGFVLITRACFASFQNTSALIYFPLFVCLFVCFFLSFLSFFLSFFRSFFLSFFLSFQKDDDKSVFIQMFVKKKLSEKEWASNCV